MDTSIPASAAPFFQEYIFSTLRADLHADLVIERLLAYGDRSEVRWLFQTYGKARLRAWVQRDGLRLLPGRRYRLWCLLLDLEPGKARIRTAWKH
jgi:hypothetical protein